MSTPALWYSLSVRAVGAGLPPVMLDLAARSFTGTVKGGGRGESTDVISLLSSSISSEESPVKSIATGFGTCYCRVSKNGQKP